MQPTEKQVSAAHAAWEETVTQWAVRRVSYYRAAEDQWILENKGSGRYDPNNAYAYADEVAAHRFVGENAEQRARLLLRDKCIRAMLDAAFAAI